MKQDEAGAVPPDGRALGRWLAAQGAAARRDIVAAGACRILLAALAVLQAWAIAATIGAIITGAALTADTIWPLALFVAAIPARALVGAAAEGRGTAAAARVKSALRRRLVDRMLGFGPNWRTDRETGALAGLLVEQVEALDGFYARHQPQRLAAMAVPPAILALVFWLDWRAGAILAGAGAAALILMIVLGIRTAAESRSRFRTLARMGAIFLDRLQGMTTLRLFGRVEAETARIATAADAFRGRTMDVLRIAFLSSAALDLCALGAVALVAGRVALGTAGLDLVTGLLLVLLAVEFLQPLRQLAATYHDRMSAVGAAEALRDLVETPPTASPAVPTAAIHPPGPALPATPPRIVFEDVSVAFDGGDRPALRHVDLAIAAGETVAVTGASGAGKSTLLQLLLGFLTPDSGRILIGGRSIDAIAPDQLLERIAWMGQSPVLFEGTLRDNLRLARPAADADALSAACAASGLSALVARLPQGLDTGIGERGIGLSGGEIQRVALARAFLKDAPILLLDEPTASLDPATEASLLGPLRRLAEGRTVILATHSRALAAIARREIRLDGGRVSAEAA